MQTSPKDALEAVKEPIRAPQPAQMTHNLCLTPVTVWGYYCKRNCLRRHRYTAKESPRPRTANDMQQMLREADAAHANTVAPGE